ncbi:hypothetical protein PM082_020378 [Marasmius tenuissimus]|nr:hypothetical protein PM082_020378 [Marasmius tenuissimus]
MKALLQCGRHVQRMFEYWNGDKEVQRRLGQMWICKYIHGFVDQCCKKPKKSNTRRRKTEDGEQSK